MERFYGQEEDCTGNYQSFHFQKFVRPPYWYYRLYEIKNYEFQVASSGIISAPNFIIKIRLAIIEFNRADTDGRTDIWSALHAVVSCILCKGVIKKQTKVQCKSHSYREITMANHCLSIGIVLRL